MSALFLIVVSVALTYVVATGVVEWRDRRRARLQELASESWAIYHAARQIHDEASAALRALLDEARGARRSS
jgi:hypothetical protein